ncbi:TPA: cupin [Pseudomonas aeruginosa]|nr:cupin [Pseudomonas aeruginosa]
MSGRPQAVPTVQVDNAEVIVTEWRFAPGAETGRHRHGHDYVVVPLVAGQAYFRKAGVEHNVINASAHEVVFVETEIK